MTNLPKSLVGVILTSLFIALIAYVPSRDFALGQSEEKLMQKSNTWILPSKMNDKNVVLEFQLLSSSISSRNDYLPEALGHQQYLRSNPKMSNVILLTNNTTAPFTATTYHKTECGALVRHFCLWNSQPRYYDETLTPKTRSGATTMCNEGTTKSKLHMVMYKPLANLPHSVKDGATLVVPFCWELYGYHLFMCLMAMYTHLQRIGLFEQVLQPRIVVGMLKSSSLFPYFMGSRTNWSDPSPPVTHFKRSQPRPSAYWKLWNVVVDSPGDVFPLPEMPPSCYSLGIFGSPPATKVSPEEAQGFRKAILHRLSVVPLRNVSMCDRFRVVILQRQTRYRIMNLKDLVEEVERCFAGKMERVTVVVLEELDFSAQLEIAINTDVLIGVHGNGLMWSAMMPPATVVIELWPSRPYNSNYYHFSLRHNLAYFQASAFEKCPARCPATFSNLPLKEALIHLQGVACNGMPFDTTESFRKVMKRQSGRNLRL